jgi:hypothetical protein
MFLFGGVPKRRQKIKAIYCLRLRLQVIIPNKAREWLGYAFQENR